MWLPASIVPARAARDDWSRHLLARLGTSLVVVLVLVAAPQAPLALARWTDAGCLFRGLTGLPCPGCGITTSLLALARGDALGSWAANPAGFGIATLLVGQAMVAMVALRRTGQADGGLRPLAWLDRLAMGGLAAAWVGRLIGTFW